jgi:hypothetical protein
MNNRFGRAIVITVSLGIAVLATSPAAQAQELGVRTGMNVNPDQFSVGGQYSLPLPNNFWFQPSADLGAGNGATLVTLSSTLVYRHPMGRRSAFTLFGGGGPEVNVYRVAGVQDTFAGATLFGGAAHASGLFVQLSRGFLDSPRMRLGVGYVFHPQAHHKAAPPRR